jgi:DNA-binding response OmpR family regulator
MDRGRILIVDDESDIRKLLKVRLELAGFDCREAGNGEEALRLVREFKPSLIILDLVMPGKDGLQTYKDFKSYPDTRNVPIIVYTAQSPDMIAEKGFEAMEIVDFVLKPFDSKALIYLIENTLGKNQK